MIDIEKIRTEFPILSTNVYGKPLIYLDNAATTQKPICVIDKITQMYNTQNSNVHRAAHYISQKATEEHENARIVIQKFIGAKKPQEIIFTKGTTESINLVASSFCREFCKPDDEILISTMEHHSNIVPWQIQADIHKLKIKIIPINDNGEICLKELENYITNKTKLISITHISNVLGTINPIKEITKIANKYNIPIFIDAAQSAQHIPINVEDIKCDFMAFSSHKIYGPTGLGILYGKEKWLEKMPPYQGGGEMISSVSFNKTTFNELPFKFEAGTPNFINTPALATAINYISEIGLNNINLYEKQLLYYATNKLLNIPNIDIIGTAKEKSSVISFLIKNKHFYDVGFLLDKMGIAVRTGHHCAEPLMNRLNINGTIRISISFYNTEKEIDTFVEALEKTIKVL